MQNVVAGVVLKKCVHFDRFKLHQVVVGDQLGQSTVVAFAFRSVQTLNLVGKVPEFSGQKGYAGDKVKVHAIDRIKKGQNVEAAVQQIDRLDERVVDDRRVERNEEQLNVENEAGAGQ